MDLKEVKEIINEEKALYVPFNYHFNSFIHQKRFMIWKYLSAFRMAQFYKEELQMESANILRKYYGKMMFRFLK